MTTFGEARRAEAAEMQGRGSKLMIEARQQMLKLWGFVLADP